MKNRNSFPGYNGSVSSGLSVPRLLFYWSPPVVWSIVIYGLFDEIHQYYVPGRFADPYDFLANIIGIMIAAWTFMKFYANPEKESGDAKV
jgi:VanZ family protein